MSISDVNSDGCFIDDFEFERGSSNRHMHSNSNMDEKKRIHNELERKRRGTIKENFDVLYGVLPHDDGEKPSRAQILSRAINHIESIKKFDQETSRFQEECEKDIALLEEELARIKKLKKRGIRASLDSEMLAIIKRLREIKPPKLQEFNLDIISNSTNTNSFSPHSSLLSSDDSSQQKSVPISFASDQDKIENSTKSISHKSTTFMNKSIEPPLSRKSEVSQSGDQPIMHTDHTYISPIYRTNPLPSATMAPFSPSVNIRNRTETIKNGVVKKESRLPSSLA